MTVKRRHLGEKLAVLTKSIGISQTELSDRLGVPPSQVNRFFRGHSDIYSSVLMGVLKELGFNLEEMISRRIKKIAEVEQVDLSSADETLLFLFNELDELGKQTYLNQLLWAAKVSKGNSFPKKIEDHVRQELSLI